jgi:hypothetical protein
MHIFWDLDLQRTYQRTQTYIPVGRMDVIEDDWRIPSDFEGPGGGVALHLMMKSVVVVVVVPAKVVITHTLGLSSVGIATRLRAGRSGFYGSIPGGGCEFFPSPPCPERLWGPPSLLSNEYRVPGMKLTIHLHLVPRSRMLGAIPPLPQYAFMAWCPVKAQGQLSLPLRLSSQRFHIFSHFYWENGGA